MLQRFFLAALPLLPGLCLAQQSLPKLPAPVSNNAVAQVQIEGQDYLLSFNGLGTGKTWRDVHARGYGLKLGDAQWHSLPTLPGDPRGRLASTAVGIGEYAYLFGGYTVAEDHSEISLPEVHRYQAADKQWQRLSPMPVPVDDSVALAYQQRYIYLVSGWHNDGNVNLVQLYDTQTDTWRQASPYPGRPVFGQGGAIVGHTMVVCDGVTVRYHAERRRSFEAEPACYRGDIDADDPSRIDWRVLPHPDGTAHYRMAAIGLAEQHAMVFLGGTDNPYNYDGTGYNGEPAQPRARLARFDLLSGKWSVKAVPEATMDHRGALLLGDKLVVVGGMDQQRRVMDTLTTLPLDKTAQ